MPVDLRRDDEFAILTLNRPEALNALSQAILGELEARLDEVSAGDARALLITGAGGRAFCAGADISGLRERTVMQQRDDLGRGQRVFARLDTLPIASIAVIDGYAFGGGLELALACTFRLGTERAKLGLPEIKLGLVPGYGGTQRLPRLIGEARALEIVMTGRTVEAEEAQAIGLLNRIVGSTDPLAAAKNFARSFTGYGLPALRLARAAVLAARDSALADGLRAEADIVTVASRTADAAEGTAAFLEKRKPAFRDA